MKTYNNSPNLSIIVPGECNCECEFCFNKTTKVKTLDINKYINKLYETLVLLPGKFAQISLTGGEPLLSNYFYDILVTIGKNKNRYKKVVLTTNGSNIDSHENIISRVIDHINISRHHYDDEKNRKIFYNNDIMGTENIKEVIGIYSRHGIDITLNCVINDKTTKEFIDKYISWGIALGIRNISFRKEHGSLLMTQAERGYDTHKIVSLNECGVCSTKLQYIKGMNVYWKKSVSEPSIEADLIYEAIYAPDGKIYSDWGLTEEINLEIKGCEPPIQSVKEIWEGCNTKSPGHC